MHVSCKSSVSLCLVDPLNSGVQTVSISEAVQGVFNDWDDDEVAFLNLTGKHSPMKDEDQSENQLGTDADAVSFAISACESKLNGDVLEGCKKLFLRYFGQPGEVYTDMRACLLVETKLLELKV